MALPTPTLRTHRLLLRPFNEGDKDAIFRIFSNPRVMRYWDGPAWASAAQADRFVVVSRKIEDEGSGARLAVTQAANGQLLGQCSLFSWNPTYRSAEVGYCFDDAVWGQGYATEALGALLQWAFDTLNLNRVQAALDTRNPASARVLEKLGFLREGTHLEDCIVNGEVSDSWVYGLLRRYREPQHPGTASAA